MLMVAWVAMLCPRDEIKYKVVSKSDVYTLYLRTGGSVGWASGCDAGGREFDSGRTITQGLKITEEKVLPLQLH